MTDLIINYLKQNKQLSNAKCSHNKRLDKSRLPDARNFYNAYGFTLKGSNGWQMVKCPFHDDAHASMGINRTHGGFKCHACGVSGDMIGFYMKYHSVNFKDACKALKIDKGAV